MILSDIEKIISGQKHINIDTITTKIKFELNDNIKNKKHSNNKENIKICFLLNVFISLFTNKYAIEFIKYNVAKNIPINFVCILYFGKII